MDATDAELCEAAGQGNQEAFAELVDRYQAVVCAVTFAATGRADLSEDLAQETFLIAWEKLHGIEQPDKVGGWLTGIARNLGRKSFRERPVVSLDEAADVRDQAQGLEERAVEQQMHAHVWELLRSLSPRYREVMVLYYREQLATPKLAAQLGISVSAAQQRLSRGRKMLREELERGVADELRRSRPHDDFRRRVAAALPVLPLAAPPTAATATTVLSSLTGVIVMHKSIYVLLAAVAVLLFGYALRDGPQEQAPSSDAPSAAQPRALAELPSPVRRAPVQATQASGQVLGAQGLKPLPGAVVTFVSEGGSLAIVHTRGASAQLAVAVADDEGSWTLPGLEPGRYRATATAPGHLPAQLRGLRISSTQELRDVRFELDAGGLPVSGLVSDIGGGPVAGATVHAKASTGLPVAALTDEDGRYKLQLPPGRHELSVWDLDYQEASARIDVRGQGSGIDFELMPAATLSGQVIARTSGEPVAGASVSFTRLESFGGGSRSTRASDDERVQTDEHGRFTLQRLSPATYKVQATASHLATEAAVEVAIGLADQRDAVVVALDPAFNISGRVMQAESSQGVAGAKVGALGGTSALTGPDGEFSLLGALPGKYPLSIEADGFVPSVADDSVTVDTQDIEGLELALDAGVSVRGQLDPPQVAEVKLALTQSVGGFGVMLQGQRIKAAQCPANEEGRFELTTVPVGTWLVVAEAADGSRGQAEITVPKAGLADIRIAMKPRASVGGTVTNTDGTPVPQATIHMLATGSDTASAVTPRRTTTTDAQGGFDFVGVESGAYELKLQNRDRLPLSAEDGSESFTVEVGETSIGDLQLQVAQASGVLAGVVMDASGEPLLDASIRLASSLKGTDMFKAPVKLTDAEGHFEFGGLPPGVYSAYARSNQGDAQGETTDIEVSEGVHSVEIRTQALASIRGTVTADGGAVGQFEVSARGAGKRTFVNDKGRFTLDRIDPSEPVVVVVTTDTGSATQRVELQPGEATEATFELGAWATVTGRALWPDGSPAAGVKISASSQGGMGQSANWLVDDLTGSEGRVTDNDGRFTVEGLGAGRAMVSFMKSAESAATSRMMIGRATWLGHENVFVESGQASDIGDIELLDAQAPEKSGTLGLRFRSSYDRPAYTDEEGYTPPIGAPDQGARLWISSVFGKGPAAEAGLTVGLEVVSLDGQPIANPGRTIVELSAIEAGRVYALGVRTEGQEARVVSVTAAPR